MPVSFPNQEIRRELSESKSKDIIFILMAGSTAVAEIPGISAAGASSELMKLTPAVDSEIIMAGRCMSMNVPPMTPEGIPTPSIITRASLRSTGIKSMIIDAGLAKEPNVPFLKSGLGMALDPRFKTSIPNFEMAVEFGRYVASILDGKYSSIVIGECIPGGTTTAYLVLRSAGYQVETSSSLQKDPSDLKRDVWKVANERVPQVSDMMDSVREFGDYSMPISIGLASGIENSRLILAGGTQMALIGRLMKMETGADPFLATTGWVIDHRKSTIEAVFGSDRLIRSDISFTSSRHSGLRQYDLGNVREGAGMGGAFMLGSIRTGEDRLYRDIDNLYETLS
ncbi:MAG: nicotinate-nucleotide--dimethylbenzimidazole phosphoribosyltransferase [Candidatus Thermoplasmatota archaeon]|nr:nicotinate-nucleotide--dimethylbenzimidazole phosphoribosyltransferase [Candidatus Thermoplasmatota archaeon]